LSVIRGGTYFHADAAEQAVALLTDFQLGFGTAVLEPYIQAILAGEPWNQILDEAATFIAEGCGIRG